MAKKILFILSVFFLTACISSSKYLSRGEFDLAINRAEKKIQKNPKNEKEILVLEQAYKKANDSNREKINFLKLEGTPENWEIIFDLYVQLKSRQEKLTPLLPLKIPSTQRMAIFEIVNYNQEILEAKQKAAEFFYAHALMLLEKNGKENARKAYDELRKVKQYYSNFRDVDTYIDKARALGTSYAILKMQNKTGIPLPPSFEDELTKITLSELNTQWLVYHVQENKNINYDYAILVNMKVIDVSPESVKEFHYAESRKVPDGWQYMTDSRGNVKKDSLGNDIKSKKFKTITCNVIETYQSKKAIISGSIDYIDNQRRHLIKTDPIASESIFEHCSALPIGDIEALKPETRVIIGRTPIPFPTGFDMLLQAGQTLKVMVKNIIWQNKNVLY